MLLRESFCHLALFWIKCALKWSWMGVRLKGTSRPTTKGWTHRKAPRQVGLMTTICKLLATTKADFLLVLVTPSYPLCLHFSFVTSCFCFSFFASVTFGSAVETDFFAPFDQKPWVVLSARGNSMTWPSQRQALFWVRLCETWPLSVNIRIGCRRVPCVFVIITVWNGLFSHRKQGSKLIIYWYIICIFCHEVAPTVYNDPDKRSGLIEPSCVGQSASTQVQRLSQCVCSALPQLSVFCHFLTLRGSRGLSGACDTVIMTQEKKPRVSRLSDQTVLWHVLFHWTT